MENSEIHQQVEEGEEDQERTHIRDSIQELKISLRLLSVKEVQLTL